MSKIKNIFLPKLKALTAFENKVLKTVTKIPRRKVTTYKLLAKAIGQATAVRAVANALSKNPWLVKIPCHRVVRSDGRLGGYRLGLKKKLLLLKKEGIKFDSKNKIRDFKKVLYEFK